MWSLTAEQEPKGKSHECGARCERKCLTISNSSMAEL
jgi:hypothetical protein